MDKVHIRDLVVPCIIGINPEEREVKQEVSINLTLHVDLARAGASDSIADTVDYRSLRDQVFELVSQSSFGLIEALAEAIATRCLRNDRVRQVDVVLDKPGALRHTRSVAVEITRPLTS